MVPWITGVPVGSSWWAFFRNKDEGAWTIPKGLMAADENYLEAACREFEEENRHYIPEKPFYELGSIKQKGGKTVHAWGFACPSNYSQWRPEADLVSNNFEIEWPLNQEGLNFSQKLTALAGLISTKPLLR